MNIVFWFLIILAAVAAWFCLSFAFRGLGGIALRLWNKAKKEITDDETGKDDSKHEG